MFCMKVCEDRYGGKWWLPVSPSPKTAWALKLNSDLPHNCTIMSFNVGYLVISLSAQTANRVELVMPAIWYSDSLAQK